jgi:hypothetical protein
MSEKWREILKTEAHLLGPHQRMEVTKHHTVTQQSQQEREGNKFQSGRLRMQLHKSKDLVCACLVEGSRMGKVANTRWQKWVIAVLDDTSGILYKENHKLHRSNNRWRGGKWMRCECPSYVLRQGRNLVRVVSGAFLGSKRNQILL